jgi:aspartate kinase
VEARPRKKCIVKLGGTTVGSPASLALALESVAALSKTYDGVILVVSAAALKGGDKTIKVTDLLLQLAAKTLMDSIMEAREIHHQVREAIWSRLPNKEGLTGIAADAHTTARGRLNELFREIHPDNLGFCRQVADEKTLTDRIVAAGEKCSAIIIALELVIRGLDAESCFTDGTSHPGLALETTGDHGNAHVLLPFKGTEHSEALRGFLEQASKIVVCTGFIGQDPKTGRTTTIGRDGSDLSASALGAAVPSVTDVYIMTDVAGICRADTSLIPHAEVIPRLSYTEAIFLSHGGAKLHPRTIEPLLESEVRLWVCQANGQCPSAEQSTIVDATGSTVTTGPIGVASRRKSRDRLITVTSFGMIIGHGDVARITNMIAEHRIPIDLVATDDLSVSFTVAESAAIEPALERLRAMGYQVTDDSGQGTITVVFKASDRSTTKSLVYGALARAGIQDNASTMGRHGDSLTIVVPRTDQDNAVKAIHDALFPQSARV